MLNKKTKKIIFMIIFILIIIGVLFYFVNKINYKNIDKNEIIENVNNEEFVQTEVNGTKVNISEKLREDKELDGLKIKNINIQTIDNVTNLIAEVENNSGQVKGDFPINIVIKDKTGKEIKEIGGYINLIKPNQTTTLRVKTSYDFSNAYDIEFKK